MNIFSLVSVCRTVFPHLSVTPCICFRKCCCSQRNIREFHVTTKYVKSLSKINSAPRPEEVRGNTSNDQHFLPSALDRSAWSASPPVPTVQGVNGLHAIDNRKISCPDSSAVKHVPCHITFHFFHFSTSSGPALGSTQSPIQ
jgi:hypothetical protein